jgi:hypothetical protein
VLGLRAGTHGVFIPSQPPSFKEQLMQLVSSLRQWLSGQHPKRSTPARRPAPRFRPQFEVLEGRDVPSTLTVSNNLDSGAGSLRAEIAVANSNDTIVFAPRLQGQTITLTSGELDITKSLTIQGPGATHLTISGGGLSRVFNVTASNVTLSGLTIADGYADLGAGVFNTGSLTLSNCVLDNNSAQQGGAIYNNGGTMTVSGCTLKGNSAVVYPGLTTGEGGGIYNNGSLSLIGSTVASNSSGYLGGGIFNDVHGILSLSYSSIVNNFSYYWNGEADVHNLGEFTAKHKSNAGVFFNG